jgi:HAD superfamily hydrolase (TIGR01549 family)
VSVARTAAVFFDVDFTLIHPGPRFHSVGYEASCARRGVIIDPNRWDGAIAAAASALDSDDGVYDPEIFVNYARRLIQLMGGEGAAVDEIARELYEEWAEHHHFSLYEDVVDTFRALRDRGIRIGLISNSHRCLTSFQAHFALDGLVSIAVSSAELGFFKPHPQIFRTALAAIGVRAAEAAMVGDSLTHDVNGARGVGMRGVLLARGVVPIMADNVPVIRSLTQLVGLLEDEDEQLAAG